MPTTVLEFEARDGHKKFGQIITCSSHVSESTSKGLGRYKGADVNRLLYPSWLRRLHQEVRNNGTFEGGPVDKVEIERVRSFLSPRNPQERK